MSASSSPEVLVIGLGAMGSATLLHLARSGVDVLGIDQFSPPHDQGSTHGETRITREAIGEGAAFVPLAQRSHVLWRELERETGRTLFNQCGGLILAQQGKPSHMHEQGDFLGNTIAYARQFDIAHEVLDADSMAQRFPQLQLQGDECGYYEPGAGYLLPEACVATQLELARSAGANIRTGVKVRNLQRDGGRTVVETDAGTLTPGTVVVCAGPWLQQLIDHPLTSALVVRRQVLYWFEAEQPAASAAEQFPIFIWNWGAGLTDVFYGFPHTDRGLKVASEQVIDATTPDSVKRSVSPAEITAMYETHVRGRLKGITPRCTATATCLYTCAPGANFLIDRLPDRENVIVVSPCSGHGFKHSAAIGEAVAEMAVSSATPEILAPFRFLF